MNRLLALIVAVLCLPLAACSGGGTPTAEPSTPAPSAEARPTPTPPPRAPEPPRPEVGACYRLTYEEALAPTTEIQPLRCTREHTAITYFVGDLDTVVDGHLLAVDATRVQERVARACPARLAAYLGADADRLALSTLRAVWFSPTLEQSDEGQSWFRCDVIALARDGRLAGLEGDLAGVLRSAAGRAAYGVCGTAEPGTPRFARVICSEPHAWRALSVYRLPGTDYPGETAVRDAAQRECQEAAKAVAEDQLNYQWGYDWPTAAQWRGGQHHGLCWAPET